MVIAVSLDEAKLKERRVEGRDVSQVPFFGSRKTPDLPLASLNQQDPGAFSSTHFHVVDQFQVVIKGKATLGRHQLAPYGIHFSRAYTPYGPLLADTTEGLSFFVMRAHPDTGGQHLPDQLEQLKRAPDRQPWQITRQVALPLLQSATRSESALLEAVPGMSDERGLAGYTLSMKADTHINAPDPSRSEGQYLVVLTGSVLNEEKEYQAPALIFVFPQEGPFRIHAGAQGLGGLVLNFPQAKKRVASDQTPSSTARLKKWQCALCAFAYDEAQGIPTDGIVPGTRWADVPDSWSCPDCGASKNDFEQSGV